MVEYDSVVNEIIELDKQYHFEIYPNPVKDFLHVSLNKQNNKASSITLYNLLGVMVETPVAINGSTTGLAIKTK